MAEWRTRGYVADSDDEDESQNFIEPALPHTALAFASEDDIRGAAPFDPGSGRLDPNNKSPKNGSSGNTEEEKSSSGDAGKQNGTHATSRALEHDGKNRRSPGVDDNGKDLNYGFGLLSYGEIDELQEEYYQDVTTAQLEEERRPRAYDFPSPALPSQSSLSRIPSSQSPPSSISSDLPDAPLGVPSSAKEIRSSQGGQRSDKDPEGRNEGSSSTPERSSHIKTHSEHDKIARTLRHRNPIQLHPYAIESERYRQTCKATGVKPLRIAQMEAKAATAPREDSQNTDYHGDDSQDLDRNSEPDDFGASSPIGTQHSTTGPVNVCDDIFVFGDDDLPDLNSMLSDPPRKYIGNGYKRRKVTSASFRMPPGMRREMRQSSPPNRSYAPDENDDVMYDVPLSPPLSGSQTPMEDNRTGPRKSQSNQIFSKVAIPTPITSSEPRKPRVLEILEDELSHDPSTLDDGSGSDDSATKEVSSHLRQVQRKIRGVLPASWLKIDLKTQKKRSDNAAKIQRSPSPERNPAQRGVARPITMERGRSPDLPVRENFFQMSDSDDLASDSDNLRQNPRTRQQTNFQDGEDGESLGERWGEASENDRVDAMLPSLRKPKHRPRNDKKRQTRIADFGPQSRSEAGNHPYIPRNHRTHHPRAVDRFDRDGRRKSKSKPPRFGILDSSSLKTSLRVQPPPFLKIASRAARSRRDRGRHSPSRKYLRLATENDNEDANETLHAWREGTIAPASNKPGTIRQPLRPRSANNATLARPSQVRKWSIRDGSLHSASAKYGAPIAGRKKLQSSLDHIVRSKPDKAEESLENVIPRESTEHSSKQRQLVSSLRNINDARPAMLEAFGVEANELNAQEVFRQDLSRINHFDNESALANVLRLFRKDMPHSPDVMPPGQRDYHADPRAKSNLAARKPIVHIKRKRRPRHLDVSTSWYRPSSTPIIVDDLPDTFRSVDEPQVSQKGVVTGLGSFGVSYSDDFGIIPLPIGTCFHESTFLGSGAFARSLRFVRDSDLDSSRGHVLLQIQGKTHRWGPWNDTVSSEIGEIATSISQTNESRVMEGQVQSPRASLDFAVSTLKAITAYFSDHLSFLDPIDRLSCTQKCKTLLPRFFLESLERSSNSMTVSQLASAICLGTVQLVFAYQVYQISQHELVSLQLREEVWSLLQRIARRQLSLISTYGFDDFQTYLSKCQHPDTVDHVIRDEGALIEAFIVARHVLTQDPSRLVDFWMSIQLKVPAKSPDGSFDIRLPEGCWKRLFTLLPFLEFDRHGLLETGRRFHEPSDNWPLIKQLVSPVLEASLMNPRGQWPSFNVYCRALFRRCLHLINGWGWRRCEPIIGTLFDFFARNQLAHLRNEGSHGSPLFLEHLGGRPSLAAEPDDRCFHVLLKIIGSGIRHMQHFYTEKKIRDITWRLMPNHGRSHPKEEAIHQADLDALRNHHDLLCTLYWASPPSCRPRLTAIRNLVHLESSHREACHINIRAWFNLIKFQLSTNEPVNALDAFRVWHDDLLVQNLHQHHLARTEAEDQVRSIRYAGGVVVSNELLESTIAKNQRQVEAILSDALISLKLAVDAAQHEHAAAAITSTSLTRVFELFDVGKPQSTKIVIQALDVLSALTSKIAKQQQRPSPREENDDSQDYGDWPSLEDDDVALAAAMADTIESPLQKFQEPLRHLLSDAFGSDVAPDDSFLLRIVDVWISVAQILVRSGMRAWNDYLDRFGKDSWTALRDTEQTRKYTPHYLATLLEKDRSISCEHASFLLNSWMSSLVERESLLKFQYQLTEALMNANCDSPVLKNLPFCTNSTSARFEISAADFSERRVSLISSVLSNMRVSSEQAIFHPSTNAAQLRQEYKDMLKHLMGTMKRNYQELGHSSNVRGAYVDFVHSVVELLQQHTSIICPIDRFFTDSGAFPLPANDPTYVVGQLKNYALRLQDSRTPKQLAVFLQSVSERAAVDGQQSYLVNQLHAAMSNTYEDGRTIRPTLRGFLVKAIVPAYIEMACTSSTSCCGWILALPYLQALRTVFKELPVDLDGVNPDSVKAVASIITAFLESVQQSFEPFLYQSSFFEEAGVLKLMSACYSAITALVPVLDYAVRLSGPTEHAIRGIRFLSVFATLMMARLRGHDDDHDIEMGDFADAAYADTRHFAKQELKDSLTKNWIYVNHEEQYYFTRGNTRREVVVEMGLYEEEKANLLKVFADFFVSLRAMPALYDDDDNSSMPRKERLSGLDEMIF